MDRQRIFSSTQKAAFIRHPHAITYEAHVILLFEETDAIILDWYIVRTTVAENKKSIIHIWNVVFLFPGPEAMQINQNYYFFQKLFMPGGIHDHPCVTSLESVNSFNIG